jgi:YfiH family protein
MNDWITPDWPTPPNVRSLFTTRTGGLSRGTYTSLNLGDHVGDDPSTVNQNRSLLQAILPSEPRWLKQVHGIRAVRADDYDCEVGSDAAFSESPGTVCAVLTADCLPVFLCDTDGLRVGIAHAGWRGLSAGVIECAIKAMGGEGSRIMAWLGPAIGPNHFEVGEEVLESFIGQDRDCSPAFTACGPGKWTADIFQLARNRLINSGVTSIYGGGICTFSDPTRFFSYRRDGTTGRMAGLIWLTP